MAKSTGPILAIGGITIFYDQVMRDVGVTPMAKIAAGTGFAAVSFALLERMNAPLTVGVAWVALITSLAMPRYSYIRMNYSAPSVIEGMLSMWNDKGDIK
jgi:hypothetical protein